MVALPWTYWFFLSSLALAALLGLVALLAGDHSPDDGGDADDPELAQGVLSLLGVGRIPLGALLSIDLLLFGGLGVVASELLSALMPRAVAATAALPLATLLAPLIGARLARAIGRRLPGLETHGVDRLGLVGRLGKAVLRVDGRFGRAHVVDDGGALHQVRCVTRGEPIERGAELVLVELDEASGSYVVERADFSAR